MRRRRAWFLRIVAVAFPLLAVLGIVQGLHERAVAQPVPGGLRTTGTIVDVRVYHGRSTTYAGVVRFTAGDGREVTFTGPTVDRRPHDGDPVPVSYDRTDPQHAHELRTNHSYWVEIGFGALVLLVYAAALARAVRLRATTGRWPGRRGAATA